LENLIEKLPNIGNPKPQNFQTLEKLMAKLPMFGNIVRENFQSLEVSLGRVSEHWKFRHPAETLRQLAR